MASVLVTGGTGTLGRVVVRELRERGHDVRVLSRRPVPEGESPQGWATGDLRLNSGVAAALSGIDTVVHAATGRGDVEATRHLLVAAKRARIRHLVYISIVGIDDIPMFYYKAKLTAERDIMASGLDFTILRATQFHDLVFGLFAAQRRLPVMMVPAISVQPIGVGPVAARLAELVEAGPSGRVADIGGPQVRTAKDLARAYQAAEGISRPVGGLTLPGKLFAALKAGRNLTPEHAVAGQTFEEYLAARFRPSG